jgi:hypothetical protein
MGGTGASGRFGHHRSLPAGGLGLLTLAFVVSSIWEREERAALIGGVIFLVLMGARTAGLEWRWR